jgi:hypothetical protein
MKDEGGRGGISRKGGWRGMKVKPNNQTHYKNYYIELIPSSPSSSPSSSSLLSPLLSYLERSVDQGRVIPPVFHIDVNLRRFQQGLQPYKARRGVNRLFRGVK